MAAGRIWRSGTHNHNNSALSWAVAVVTALALTLLANRLARRREAVESRLTISVMTYPSARRAGANECAKLPAPTIAILGFRVTGAAYHPPIQFRRLRTGRQLVAARGGLACPLAYVGYIVGYGEIRQVTIQQIPCHLVPRGLSRSRVLGYNGSRARAGWCSSSTRCSPAFRFDRRFGG